MEISFPHKGIQEWDNAHGIHIFRLHYSADEAKTAEWAAKQKSQMTNSADYEQEFEISFSAKMGTLIYQMKREATLEPLSALPPEGTDYMALDPHPVVPHFFLWVRVDKWGDAWAFRELWPSKIYGLKGSPPEDDNRYSIKNYVETAQYLESAEVNGKDLDVYKRVIDYAARAMGQGFFDENPEYNFQKRYEDLTGWSFEDCIKDNTAGPEAVNEWLKPRDVEQADGTFEPKSRFHIIQERCQELIWELENNRYQQLTPIMAERSDPTGKPVAKRNHGTDCLKYLCMAGLEYIPPAKKITSNWQPIAKGIRA